jgi:Icc-related predicted phosphoesterase
MKCLYTSDLHGEIHLYKELLSLATSASPEIIIIGGDALPSFPPTKRYEELVPNQKTFVDQFLSPLFKRILETTSTQQIFLIPGNWDLGYPYIFKEPTERITLFDQKIMRRWMIEKPLGLPRRIHLIFDLLIKLTS